MKIKISLIILFGIITLNLFAQQTAKPNKGEGTIAFLKRYGCTENDIPEFERINKGKFGKNTTLRLDTYYTIPAKGSNQGKKDSKEEPKSTNIGKIYTEPLFGKAKEKYSIQTNQLKDACFFLVSGHGGWDSGATTKINGYEIHEDEYAYDVMLRLARNLLEHGATVHIIIQDPNDGIREERFLKNSSNETCMGEPIKSPDIPKLEQRTNKINELSQKSKAKYQRAIFIHIDSFDDSKVGIDPYFFEQNNSAASKKLATAMRTVMKAKYGKHQPDKLFKERIREQNIKVLRDTKVPSVLVELANIQCPKNHERLLSPNNRAALANWMLEGFIKDYQSEK